MLDSSCTTSSGCHLEGLCLAMKKQYPMSLSLIIPGITMGLYADVKTTTWFSLRNAQLLFTVRWAVSWREQSLLTINYISHTSSTPGFGRWLSILNEALSFEILRNMCTHP